MSLAPPSPSDTEMEILKRFWRDGDLSARELQARIAGTCTGSPSIPTSIPKSRSWAD